MTKTTKTTNKTTFQAIEAALTNFSNYFTVQDNIENGYARICFTDNYKKDNYKLFKDFAIYYDRKDSYKISIADSTLVDCKAFKESHERTDKTRALEFSIKSDALVPTVYEILAQRLLQSDKCLEVVPKTSTKQTKKTKKTA